MDPSSSSCRRSQLDAYEAIDRAMLDCFAESMGPMDYNSGNAFINESEEDFMPPSNQSTLYSTDVNKGMEKRTTSLKRPMPTSTSMSPSLNFNLQHQSESNSAVLNGLLPFSMELTQSGADQSRPSFSNKKNLPVRSEYYPQESVVPATKSELKSQHVIVSRERRRERNKFLARKTRVKKKAEVENLWAQVNQLRTENERLKEAVRVSNPKPAEEILSNCHFVLPKKVVDFVDGMVAEDQDAELDLKSSRCFCITNATAPDDPIVYASPDFVELTGYAMHSILGHNCRFLQGPDTDKNELKKITSAIKDGRKVTVTVKNYRRDGSAFWNRIKVCPMKDEDGKVSLIVGLQKEVFRSTSQSGDFTSVNPLGTSDSGSGSTSGLSDSNGDGEGEGEADRSGSSRNVGSEDGTTDCTNDEESHSGSTNSSEE